MLRLTPSRVLSQLSLVRVTRGVCREQPTSTFKLLALDAYIVSCALECQRPFEALPRAALRPRTESCDSEKTWVGVELTGIEPVASGLQSPRSPS